jgi:hypothetical protein
VSSLSQHARHHQKKIKNKKIKNKKQHTHTHTHTTKLRRKLEEEEEEEEHSYSLSSTLRNRKKKITTANRKNRNKHPPRRHAADSPKPTTSPRLGCPLVRDHPVCISTTPATDHVHLYLNRDPAAGRTVFVGECLLALSSASSQVTHNNNASSLSMPQNQQPVAPS